ncbi:O-acyltransferase like protein-like [Teleopsis dalmanni]|uniref:O-acyltransferase like protein-like n=1 Tax=Teleopsis dalmanni TaxID=139649 RepID=UPI0018CE5ACD|nr:O-acyltransferase like protein-like [Teleopsis dalmanni]
MIFFFGTLLEQLSDGPNWIHAIQHHQTNARENWWKSLLFINNFSNSASFQTWFVAVDMQLFVFFLIILTFNAKYPQYKKFIYAIITAISILLPPLLANYYNLVYNTLVQSESLRYMEYQYIGYNVKVLYTIYSTVGIYLFGIITGEIYMEIKRRTNHKSFKGVFIYEIGWWILYVAVSILPSFKFKSVEDNPALSSLTSHILCNIWAVGYCILILGLTFKLGGIMRMGLSSAFAVKMSRIVYQLYLWHMAALYIIYGYIRQPLYSNDLHFNLRFILFQCVAWSLSFILTLIFEYPINKIFDILLNKENMIGSENSKSK